MSNTYNNAIFLSKNTDRLIHEIDVYMSIYGKYFDTICLFFLDSMDVWHNQSNYSKDAVKNVSLHCTCFQLLVDYRNICKIIETPNNFCDVQRSNINYHVFAPD